MAAATPAGAGAFIGEGSVLNGAKSDLTGPAKTILSKPTFLTTNVAEAGVAKGVAEASRAAGVFQAAGLLPSLGAVLSFGVGTVIGSEICHVIGIEGCWYFGSEGADPAETGPGEWSYRTAPLTTAEPGVYQDAPGYQWYYWQGAWIKSYDGYGGLTKCPGVSIAPPSAMSAFWPLNGGSCSGVKYDAGAAIRWSMENRTLEYHATDNPAIGNYSHTAPSDWSNRAATALKNQPDDSPAGRVGQYIASQIEGSGVASPYAVYVEIPDCGAFLWGECAEQLEELGLEPSRVELDWETAVLTKPADAVVETSPAKGATVETGTKITVTTNPPEEGMPIVIPAPEEGETYDEYAARLNPALTPERHDLEAAYVDPSTGPNGVVDVLPEPETRLDPSTSHEVKVSTNPADAPAPSAAWSPPEIPSIDLTPLSAVAIGCTDFPFGIFCWIGDGLTAWGPGGECPQLGVPFGSSIGLDDELAFDTCLFEPAMEIVRPVLILVAAFSLAYLFAAAAMGFGGGTGDD